MPTREAGTNKIQDEKRSRGLRWKKITEGIGPGSPILYTAALLGQMTLTKSEAEIAAKLLGLSEAEAAILTESAKSRFAADITSDGPSYLSFLRARADLWNHMEGVDRGRV
jgi:cyanate lyase